MEGQRKNRKLNIATCTYKKIFNMGMQIDHQQLKQDSVREPQSVKHLRHNFGLCSILNWDWVKSLLGFMVSHNAQIFVVNVFSNYSTCYPWEQSGWGGMRHFWHNSCIQIILKSHNFILHLGSMLSPTTDLCGQTTLIPVQTFNLLGSSTVRCHCMVPKQLMHRLMSKLQVWHTNSE